MQQRQISTEIYVNPIKGDDTALGNSMHPFQTLTHALQKATPGMMIQLGRGTYSAKSGEVFPLIVPASVAIVGNLPTQGAGVVLEGSGVYDSPTFGQQNVTVVMQGDAELRGVTVTNLAVKGTGVWVESAAPTISSCTLAKCAREGIFVTGTANPVITSCMFQENTASGLTLVRHARGEIRSNVWRQNGFGIAISDRAAPIVISNQIVENRCGAVLSGAASPILRGNLFAQNREDGLAIFNNAQPDLGKPFDPAGNRFRDNQRFDLRNATPLKLTSVGNQLNPSRLNGLVEFLTTRSPATVLAASAPAASLSNQQLIPAPTHAPADMKHHWAAAFVQPLLDRQILLKASDGNFHPEATVSASEFAAWRQAALGSGEVATYSTALTRLETVVTLVKALELKGGHPSLLSRFRDRAQIPSAQTLAVTTAIQHQLLVSPDSNSLNLLCPVTRAEAAAMLYLAMVIKGFAVPIEAPQILAPGKVNLPGSMQPVMERPPVVVLDPGHGGSDTGVVTQVKSAEAEMMQAMPMEMFSQDIPISPLPSGALTMPSGMPGEMTPVSPRLSSMPLDLTAPLGMPDAIAGMLEEGMPSLQEKALVLQIAQAVASFLQQQGIQVVLTRSDDRALTLAERVEIAQQHHADALISFHANASLTNDPDINGIETYYSPDSQAGACLAWAVHKALTRAPEMVDRGVHPATFYTLRNPAIVATQIEVGYITGNKDAPSLANLAYHRYLGRAIANGILRYVRQRGR